MDFETLAVPAVILLSLTSLVLLISRGWRWSIIALAVQYIPVFILVAAHWPLEMAVTKIVAGWMSGAVLGIAVGEARSAGAVNPGKAKENSPSSYLFRLLAATLGALIVISLAPKFSLWAPGMSLAQAQGCLILLVMGILQLGLTAQPLRVILGLLTILSGFEISYAGVETSTMVAGLLAAVNLGLALIGAYLIMAPTMEETE